MKGEGGGGGGGWGGKSLPRGDGEEEDEESARLAKIAALRAMMRAREAPQQRPLPEHQPLMDLATAVWERK